MRSEFYSDRVIELARTHPLIFQVKSEVVIEIVGWFDISIGLHPEFTTSFEGVEVKLVVDDFYSRDIYFAFFEEQHKNEAMLFKLKYTCESVSSEEILKTGSWQNWMKNNIEKVYSNE
jgi:hypothetical protein